jgi:hypothetical protein
MHDEHWTELEIEALKEAHTFEDAANIAICILGRMTSTRSQVIQICGPMSSGGLGSLSKNMERFELAIERAKLHGLVVFNQIPFQEAIIRLSDFQEGAEGYNTSILEVFYRKIFESGHIHKALFLEDWESSIGARWERDVVSRMDISVEEYPSEWLA